MSSGDGVVAPVSGSVTFAGRVPGAGGGSILCVSLETELGTVSLLPLRDISVTRGQPVLAGQHVGALAGEGDASSAREHLHAGLRVEGDYVDPSVLIAGLLASAGGSSEGAIVSGEPAPRTVDAAPLADPAPGSDVSAGVGSTLSGTVPSALALPPLEVAATTPPASQVGSVPNANVILRPLPEAQPNAAPQPGAAVELDALTQTGASLRMVSAPRARPVAAAGWLRAMNAAARPISGAIPVPVRLDADRFDGVSASGAPVVQEAFARDLSLCSVAMGPQVTSTGATIAGGLARLAGERSTAFANRYAGAVAAGMTAALAMMSYAGLIMVTRRLMTRHVRRGGSLPLRLGITLQHPGVGGRLRGLTSCSGPTAFTVPGPPAQRR